ncbi:MAG TPA: hypothetical protein VJT73_13075 [Polyangiaceae bacterium]|nr:hypothetical protein [Polyangiaceae bacterium]
MPDTTELLAEIESALKTVQRVLDALTSRGDDQAAFDLARAQYSASLRTSWPGSLSSLIRPLSDVAGNASLKLDASERSDLERAIASLRRILNV